MTLLTENELIRILEHVLIFFFFLLFLYTAAKQTGKKNVINKIYGTFFSS